MAGGTRGDGVLVGVALALLAVGAGVGVALGPALLELLADRVVAGGQALEAVAALAALLGARGGGLVDRVALAVGAEQVDGPAGEPGLVGVAVAVAV